MAREDDEVSRTWSTDVDAMPIDCPVEAVATGSGGGGRGKDQVVIACRLERHRVREATGQQPRRVEVTTRRGGKWGQPRTVWRWRELPPEKRPPVPRQGTAAAVCRDPIREPAWRPTRLPDAPRWEDLRLRIVQTGWR